MTSKVGSFLVESGCRVPEALATSMAACISTGTTFESDKVCLLVLSAFQAKLRNR